MTVLPGKASELLPEPADIFDLSDDELERIAEKFYCCFNTKQRVEPDGLQPSIVEAIFSEYEHHLSTREHSVRRLRKIMNPKGYAVITEESFVDGLPFLLRLVQVHLEAEEERNRLMSKLEDQAKVAEEKKTKLLGKGYDAGPGFMRPTTVSLQKEADTDSLVSPTGSQGAPRFTRLQSALPRSTSSSAKPRVPLKRCETNNGAGRDGPSCAAPQRLSSRRSSECGGPRKVTINTRRLSYSSDASESPSTSPNAASGVQERPRSIAALSVSRKEIICLRSLFQDIDVFKKGFITWTQLRSRTPTLPKEPVLGGKKLERDAELDFFTFIRIVFPEVPEEDAHVLSLQGAKVREFVLPQEKRLELQEVFCALNGGKVRDSLKPYQLVQGLRDSEYNMLSIAQAYTLLFVEPRDEVDITLGQFKAWYCDEILSEKFKAFHTKTIKKAAILVAESAYE